MFPLLAALIAQATPTQAVEPSCAGGLISVPPGETCPFLLFFDSSKAEVTRDSAAALDKLLSDWRSGSFRRVILTGHGDLFGPAVANLRTSRQRAEVVRDWLNSRGIPLGAITIQAVGETRPLVATADGVREPQNRRVEARLER